MRIAISSDLHLGERKFRRRVNGFDNMYKMMNYACFDELIRHAAEQADALLLAGDVFDNPNPDVEAIFQAQKLNGLPMDVYAISGNHEWSPSLNASMLHSFDILQQGTTGQQYVKRYLTKPEYVDLEHKIRIWFLPYGFLTPEWFDAVRQNLFHNKDQWNILVAHGSVDFSGHYDGENPYLLPKEIAQWFDLVICGHVHLPGQDERFVLKHGQPKVLVPGSLMPSNAALTLLDTKQAESAWWLLDTKDMSVTKHYFTLSPKVHVYQLQTSEEVNEVLLHIGEQRGSVPSINHIAWPQSFSDLDMGAYKKALLSSLNLSLAPGKMKQTEVQGQKLETFWEWVQNEHPSWYDRFMTICQQT